MSAQRLRDAATKLREVAEDTTGDEWLVGSPLRCSSTKAVEIEYKRNVFAQAYTGTEANATYIATMSPPVALALADWLDVMARCVDSGNDVPGMRGRGLTEALKLADTILGPTA